VTAIEDALRVAGALIEAQAPTMRRRPRLLAPGTVTSFDSDLRRAFVTTDDGGSIEAAVLDADVTPGQRVMIGFEQPHGAFVQGAVGTPPGGDYVPLTGGDVDVAYTGALEWAADTVKFISTSHLRLESGGQMQIDGAAGVFITASSGTDLSLVAEDDIFLTATDDIIASFDRFQLSGADLSNNVTHSYRNGIKQPTFAFGVLSGSTNASGFVTINHGLPGTPTGVWANVNNGLYDSLTSGLNSSSFDTYLFTRSTGLTVGAGVSVTGWWLAAYNT
jgi:hypothetical protein